MCMHFFISCLLYVNFSHFFEYFLHSDIITFCAFIFANFLLLDIVHWKLYCIYVLVCSSIRSEIVQHFTRFQQIYVFSQPNTDRGKRITTLSLSGICFNLVQKTTQLQTCCSVVQHFKNISWRIQKPQTKGVFHFIGFISLKIWDPDYSGSAGTIQLIL